MRSADTGVLLIDEGLVDVAVVFTEKLQALLIPQVFVLLLDDLQLELPQLFI
jgi:hypothetical protein